ARGIARVSGDEPHNWNGRTNLPRQNAYDVVFVLLRKHVAEHKEADIDVSVFKPLRCLGGVIRGSGGDALSTGAKLNLTLCGYLIGDTEFVKRLPRSLSGGREVRVFISNGLR